jgi:hypothetical protein
MAATPDPLARLEAQRAYFASDDRVRERAEAWSDATPEECLEAVREECEAAMQLLALKTPIELEAALRPDPIPSDTIAILESIQRLSR